MMDSPIVFIALVTLCILCALITLISFLLFLKARTAERGHPDDPEPDLSKHAALDEKERLYRSIHFISLCLFVVLGVLILVIISRRID